MVTKLKDNLLEYFVELWSSDFFLDWSKALFVLIPLGICTLCVFIEKLFKKEKTKNGNQN